MTPEFLKQIRYDLDLVLPNDAYTLTWQQGDHPLRLTWDERVHDNLRRIAENMLSLHNVRFETELLNVGQRGYLDSLSAPSEFYAGEPLSSGCVLDDHRHQAVTRRHPE